MTDKIVTLTIEKLAGLGDGLAVHAGHRIFVPYTLAGDVVRARIVRETKDASYAAIEEIITPGAGWIQPVCRHFSACGGCTLQHVNGDDYRDFKQQMAREAVRKAGFDPACVEPLLSMLTASRRRVDLKVYGGRLGYYEEGSHRLVDIEECRVVEPALEALLLRMKPKLLALPGLTGVQINGVDEGYDIVLSGGGSSKWQVAGEKDVRRISVYERKEARTLFESGPVTVRMGEVTVNVPPGAFLQASREAQAVMTRFVLEAAGDAPDVLDLFAGLGTFGFPLSTRAQVTAVEAEWAMVKAMKEAAARHTLADRFKAERRDLFQSPVPSGELGDYDAVIINPPRGGAKEQCAMLARSNVKKLVMISCNPATFSRDARLLREGGYRLKKLVPIDQFVYSPHLEINAEFTK
jgi:23S rRNA (uracil1939-C5)-methyltransferase